MDQTTTQELLGIGQDILGQIELFLIGLMREWNLYQLLILLAVFLAATLLKRLTAPPLHDWMRSRRDWPMWRMRYLVVLHKRLRAFWFVLLLWLVVWVMREATWPSRSYLLGVAANLATAWLIVVFATRLIGNPLLRSMIRWSAWIWITLRILGLTEEAVRVLDGAAVQLGDLRLSLWLVVRAVFWLGVLLFVAQFLARSSASRIRANEDISPSMQVLAVKVLQIVFFTVAFLIGLRVIGVDLTGFAVLSGAIGVGLGFGLQKVVSNLVSGVILLLDKSIKPGDVISLGETFGWITTLGARYVSITTRDGKEYLIPNEDLITGQVVNWSHKDRFVRLDIYFGTSYGDNPHDVRRIAIEATSAVPRVLADRPPVCHIVGFGDSSVDYILRFWITDPTGGLTNIRGNVYLALWDAFQANGISIPFPQREVKVLDGSTLGVARPSRADRPVSGD
ncbi:mechanosensitive ion channel family protein [Wenxinia marina]|uniref:Small-conductance mechanosensitive channel n=1 Tax=Wenxinia marina DSM 24838 TaxID=1123501 RepID=A0A0D0PIT3_9RHOB|nr:mechanosensitive ion channel domain-containing protein [Wenxinia marina]KIQ71276.1 Small-conductance mechanosensitive channel [Wenxinia marina DSM 24838]GGL73453.1 mechanosensitive ion channel protein [Wenxinia marina]